MNLLTTIVLLACIPPTHVTPPALKPLTVTQKEHRGGTWYMAEDGHAVLCYGPTMYIPTGPGDLTKVATFCRGDKAIVKLRE